MSAGQPPNSDARGSLPSAVAGIGGAAVVVATAAAAALPDTHQVSGLLLVGVAVGCSAAMGADGRTVLGLTGLAYVLANGLIFSGSWLWAGDGSKLCLIVLGLAVGLGRGQRWMQLDARSDDDGIAPQENP